MKWSWFGRASMALIAALAMGLGMTACGGPIIGFIWATGTQNTQNVQYNQTVGYWINDYTGNLTGMPGQPFSTNGTNPVYLIVRPGGRFLYVINQGDGYTAKGAGTSDNISLYSIGGGGTLTFQLSYETQGYGHLWAAFDSTGGYLYILDKFSPAGDGNGAITTFASDPTTGRLNLQTQTASTQPGQLAPNYLEVGTNPLRFYSNGSCLFTANSGNQTITTYSIANGQLNTVTTGVFTPGTVNMTSINGNGQYVFLTDNQNNTNSGLIFPYTVSGNCALTPFTGGAKQNSVTAFNPVNTLISNSGKYLYVLNSSSTSTNPTTSGSTLSAYNINTQSGTLIEISGSPFVSGPGPVCAAEDPTGKYIYVANSTDGSITGYLYSDTNGQLANLSRGSTFQSSVKGLSCLALSGTI